MSGELAIIVLILGAFALGLIVGTARACEKGSCLLCGKCWRADRGKDGKHEG